MTCIRLALALLIAASPLAAKSQSELVKGVPIFETPVFAEQQSVIFELIRTGALDRAAQRLNRLIERYPNAPRLHIVKAELAISRNDAETAFGALSQASSLGYAELKKTLAAPGFRTLMDDARMQALLDAKPVAIARAPFSPGLVKKGVGLVTAENTRWNADLARLEVVFTLPPSQKSKPVSRQKDEVMARLTKLVRRGQAAGNLGDVYDNRDGRHSPLAGLKDVQLTVTAYDEAAKTRGVHYGLNEALIFDAVTFGNSSTALQGKNWRSQARHALTTEVGPIRAWQLYDNNHVYVFPEHRDHDAVIDGGWGDLFPANTPLMLISKGSSKSDRQFLKAIQIILAGFKPDVKRLLTETRLIAPTVQQIIRRGMKGIETEDDYLGPAAHPTVFDPESVELKRILMLANEMTADRVPPRAQIEVTTEHKDTSPFQAPVSEVLFTTRDAIARMWRGGGRLRTYRLSAQRSFDANDRPLTYFWRVIGGDPTKVTIDRVTPDASEVEVTIEWHEGYENSTGLTSSRVDIALFAHNGAEYSAPATFSVDVPTHQRRIYSEDPSEHRPISVAYLPKRGEKAYADVLIWPARAWSDAFDYDEQGNLLGWMRTYRDGKTARFTQHGLRVIETDAQGRPAKAEGVRYQMARGENGGAFLKEQPIGRVFSYTYVDEVTRLGLPVDVKAD